MFTCSECSPGKSQLLTPTPGSFSTSHTESGSYLPHKSRLLLVHQPPTTSGKTPLEPTKSPGMLAPLILLIPHLTPACLEHVPSTSEHAHKRGSDLSSHGLKQAVWSDTGSSECVHMQLRGHFIYHWNASTSEVEYNATAVFSSLGEVIKADFSLKQHFCFVKRVKVLKCVVQSGTRQQPFEMLMETAADRPTPK